MKKIRKGDKVVILAGKDKGRTGEVVRVMPKDDKALVRGIKHDRSPSAPVRQPGRRHYPQGKAPIHLSNIAIADPKDGKPTRVGFEVREGGKVRIAKRSGEVING